MGGKGMGSETAKRLAPSSWPGVATWAVIVVVFATHPIQATKFTASTIWSTGSWIGYTAFADCGEEPPFGWMEPKACEAPARAPVEVVEGAGVDEAQAQGEGEFGAVYGVELPAPATVKAWVGGVRERSSVLVLDENGDPRG